MLKRAGLIISILLFLVIILSGLVIYTYVGKPYISGYSTKLYNQGANDALTILVNQVQARGYAEIPLGNNQALVLVPVQPNPPASEQTTETE